MILKNACLTLEIYKPLWKNYGQNESVKKIVVKRGQGERDGEKVPIQGAHYIFDQ